MQLVLYGLGAAVTTVSVAWSIAAEMRARAQEARLRKLEAAEAEREEAENSTIIQRPKEFRFKSLRPVPWEKQG
jgi:hypothetical protein